MTFSIIKKASLAALTAATVMAAMPAAACSIVVTDINGVWNQTGVGSANGCNFNGVGVVGNGNFVESTTNGHLNSNATSIFGSGNYVQSNTTGFGNNTETAVFGNNNTVVNSTNGVGNNT